MAKVTTTVIEHNEMMCSNLDDLAAALRAIEEAPEDTQVEMSILIDIPGVGKKKLLLLDEVAVHIGWSTETE